MSNIGWVYGILKQEHNVDTKDMTPEEAFEKLRELERSDYKKGKKHIELPKKEYARMCSIIRTKFQDNIPKNGGVFDDMNYLRYTYNKNTGQILCTCRLDIEKNRERINLYEELRND